MYNTIIEVKAFGDFDISYTVCIMVHEEKKDTNVIIKEFCKIMDIYSIKGLPSNKLYEYTEDFISYLKLIGFTELETIKINMCD